MKLKIILICIVAILGGLNFFQGYLLNKEKQENNRLTYTLENVNQELQIVTDKNGELHSTVNSLNLKSSELKKINSSLNSELKNMKIKIKNLENANIINIEYTQNIDTVPTHKITFEPDEIPNQAPIDKNIAVVDTLPILRWQSVIDNDYTNATWNSTYNPNIDSFFVTDYRAALKDTLITATEITYKGWWFWKKPKEIKFHIKSMNPYSNFEKIESIRFTK